LVFGVDIVGRWGCESAWRMVARMNPARLLYCVHFASAIVLLVVNAASAEQLRTYCNERFRVCVKYPRTFIFEAPPMNGDGQGFRDGHGLRMSVSGIDNRDQSTLDSEMSDSERDLDKVSFRTRGDNWFVLSGYKGNHAVYERTFVGTGSINHLHIEFPAALKKRYQPLVDTISASLTPGPLDHNGWADWQP
jgi:hypothetical protein